MGKLFQPLSEPNLLLEITALGEDCGFFLSVKYNNCQEL